MRICKDLPKGWWKGQGLVKSGLESQSLSLSSNNGKVILVAPDPGGFWDKKTFGFGMEKSKSSQPVPGPDLGIPKEGHSKNFPLHPMLALSPLQENCSLMILHLPLDNFPTLFT